MRLRNQVAWSLLVQGGGAVAMLVSIVLLGHYLGPAAQGVFSRVKVEVEFIGALAMFGLPQAMFYFVHASRMSRRRATGLAVAGALIGGVFALIYGGLVLQWIIADLVMFALAAMALAWHGCLRGVVLSVSTSRLFNVVSALPQGLLLLYVLVALAVGRVDQREVALAFAASFALAALFGLRVILTASPLIGERRISEEPFLSVARYGMASGLAAIGASTSILLAIHAVHGHFGAVELGVFTFAVALTQGLLVPLNYAIPLLFKRWMEQHDPLIPVRAGLLAAMALGAVALIVRYLQRDLGPETWLAAYSPMADFLWILLLAAAADAFQKIVAVSANARGAPWLPAASEVLRLLVVAGGLAVWPIQHTADVAWIVCVAAIISASLQYFFYRRLSRVRMVAAS